MSMDGLSLYGMLWELRDLCGSRIDKVQQPDKDSLVLSCHGGACGRVKLYLNIHNELGRVQLTGESFENPAVAPAFCMLLRKRLIGCRIQQLRQCGTDRVIAVSFSGRDELQDEQSYTLVLELMGRHGNLLLLNSDGVIMDCLRHIGLGEGVTRPALPQLTYTEPPAQDKLDPFTAEEADFAETQTCKQLTARFARLSRQTAELIWAQADAAGNRAHALREAFAALRDHTASPCVLPGIGVLPFTPENRPEAVPYPTLSEAFSAFYRERDVRMRMDRLCSRLRTALEHARTRCLHKLEGFTQDMNSGEKAEQYRLYGELLTAFYGNAPRGAESVLADNWYADPPEKIAVPLRSDLDIAGNAAAYFKKYRKLKAAREYAAAEIQKLTEELSYLEGQLLSLSLCETAAEADEIREELIRLRYIRTDEEKKKQPKAQSTSAPLSFISSAGVQILVGKNNLQNDRITKNAPENALWLHAKDMPGSHVIVLCRGACDGETLREAALLAAWYSKGRASAQVPVDYLPARHVKKPAGSRPGFVTFTGQRTVYVTPREELILRLRKGKI